MLPASVQLPQYLDIEAWLRIGIQVPHGLTQLRNCSAVHIPDLKWSTFEKDARRTQEQKKTESNGLSGAYMLEQKRLRPSCALGWFHDFIFLKIMSFAEK